ncbi:MAG: TIGR04282 family arsenosugar biosynthesis glycosyltransferase [Chloroflexi bacterium]|nr:TIGR04282 family arsenosugar biosynthesis glycosyltransferase [Chloroflexota bacterium]
MAKVPRAGTTKTRLCPPLTPEQAADLYGALLEDTLDFVAGLPGIQPAIAVTPPEDAAYFRNRALDGMRLYPVEAGDVGEALDRSLTTALAEGHPKALAIHSDGPTFSPKVIAEAIEALEARDVVIGPCDDGGYYLIGLKRACEPLFRGIEWSTSRVTGQTLERAAGLGLGTYLLPGAMDVDTAEDLARLTAKLRDGSLDGLRRTRALLDGNLHDPSPLRS